MRGADRTGGLPNWSTAGVVHRAIAPPWSTFAMASRLAGGAGGFELDLLRWLARRLHCGRFPQQIARSAPSSSKTWELTYFCDDGASRRSIPPDFAR
jgi:hypothetical protein